MKNQHIVVLVTAKNKLEARKITQGLLKERIVACVNILDGVESHFTWKGKLEHSKETLLVIKAKQKVFEQVVNVVKKLHSYDNPEIIALPIVAGSWPYLKWIDEVVS